MSWKNSILDQLTTALPCGYDSAGPAATEPTALAALALIGHAQPAAAAARWLAELQAGDGSVGVTESQSRPKWPTSLAILVWQQVDSAQYKDNLQGAVTWSLQARGSTGPRQPHIGHDTTLTGWSWAADTHAWLEPTALFTMALKQAGYARHARTREAVQLLTDRLLPTGGANYGNTIVLGQPLLAHIQSTGLAMLALAGEDATDPRIELSLAYLERELNSQVPAASLSYGVLGLAAHGRRPPTADNWLHTAYLREQRRGASPHKLALLALAAAPMNPMLAGAPTAAVT